MGKAKASSTSRTRNFAFIVYPDSARDDWLLRLDDLHLQAFVSPLHDSDLNPSGEVKKSHYHVIIMFDGVKTLEQANDVYRFVVGDDGFLGNGCDICRSVRSYARYLCHLDNPDKFQYSISSVRCFGGVDYREFIASNSDRYQGIRAMLDFIKLNNIYSFSEFLDYASSENNTWFELCCDNSGYIVKEYIKSFEYTSRKLQ